MKSQTIPFHLPPPPKTAEEISNRYAFLENRKQTVAATASHFTTGNQDPALATQLLLIELRQRELLWCLSKTPPLDA